MPRKKDRRKVRKPNKYGVVISVCIQVKESILFMQYSVCKTRSKILTNLGRRSDPDREELNRALLQ